jgi:hypothetical protein
VKKTANSELLGKMRPEYDFDYTKARPNRFAGRVEGPISGSFRPGYFSSFYYPRICQNGPSSTHYFHAHDQGSAELQIYNEIRSKENSLTPGGRRNASQFESDS